MIIYKGWENSGETDLADLAKTGVRQDKYRVGPRKRSSRDKGPEEPDQSLVKE